jgi:hypothetical protein
MLNEILAFCSESMQWFIVSETISKGYPFEKYLMVLNQRSMIRYYVLHKKSEHGDRGETQPRIWQGCFL